jgi:hypothetical protein
LKKRSVCVLFIATIIAGLFLFAGGGKAVSGSLALPTKMQSKSTTSLFLPVVYKNFSKNQSPFWVQIAALHQIPTNVMLTEPAMSSKERMSYLEESFPTLIKALERSGATGTRILLRWSDIEPDEPIGGQPQYSSNGWEWYDARLNQLAATGKDILVTVAPAPEWAAEPPCAPFYSDRFDEYARFLTDLVNRYKVPPYNIRYWEMVNEPDYTWSNGDLRGYGCWGNDGDEYAKALSFAYQAIKAADSQAIVLMGGLAYDGFTEYGGAFNRYFSDTVMQAGGGAFIDVLNFHYFPVFHEEWERWDPNSEDRQKDWLPAPTCGDYFDGQGATYEAGGIDLIAKTSHYRNRMNTCFGLDKPVWVTELADHGYANDPESLNQQARYVIQGNVRGVAAGVTNIVWYAMVTPNDGFHQGLLYDDFSPKPAFYSYQTMTSQLDGYLFSYTMTVVNVEAYVFKSGTGQEKVVAWGSGSLRFASVSQLLVVNRNGEQTWINDGGEGDVDGIQNGVILYQTSEEPVFIQAF